jgi:hypothetical protein
VLYIFDFPHDLIRKPRTLFGIMRYGSRANRISNVADTSDAAMIRRAKGACHQVAV